MKCFTTLNGDVEQLLTAAYIFNEIECDKLICDNTVMKSFYLMHLLKRTNVTVDHKGTQACRKLDINIAIDK